MQTQCISEQFEFEGLKRRRVVAAFDGGSITTNAGALLLRHVDRAIGLFSRVASCFSDHRNPELVVHSLEAMVGQRIAGIALGFEDIEDHDELRFDPVLALLSDQLEPKRKDCEALAGKSTLNRLEHAPAGTPTRYHRIGHDAEALKNLLVDLFTEAHDKAPRRITLDLDATDDPIHGHQEGRFFHGYYDCYCYLPLYIFAGRHLLAAKLRKADADGAAGAKEEVERIVARIRERWPRTRILLRADSGFAREELMAWCEANDVDFLFGLARNKRLARKVKAELAEAKAEYAKTGAPARRFADFHYATKKSWNRRRRVVGKAEWTPGVDGGKANPRFVVTTLKTAEYDARALYEDLYCQRGEMENRIKECQLDLFADRTSAKSMRANQLRLWFASFAYVLLDNLRRLGLRHTRLQDATCGTLRLKLLKIGARVTVSARRIMVSMASAHPWLQEFALAHARIRPAAR
jgi:hypothetical protein